MNDRIILDLCGGTGAWSKPYLDGGYDVRVITLPGFDVCKFEPPKNVYGVLAAPPCTEFSFARTNAKVPRNFEKGLKVIRACMDIIWKCRLDGKLKFWAMENPKGYMRQFMGKPPYEFNPYDFGDRYSKATDLFGFYNFPIKKSIELSKEERIRFAVRKEKLQPIEIKNLFNPEGYERPHDMKEIRTIQRAITPAGFAMAFFKANK